jgi:hypothetical protein
MGGKLIRRLSKAQGTASGRAAKLHVPIAARQIDVPRLNDLPGSCLANWNAAQAVEAFG